MSGAGDTAILVVEDEPLIRLSIRYYLERHGYRVLEAECVSSALGLLSECGVDLLLTDFDLRKGGGLELVQRALELDSELPWLVMSAYPLAFSGAHPPWVGPDQVLQKPFSEPELLARVRGCLSERKR